MDFDRDEPDESNGFQAANAALIAASHARLLRRPLLPEGGADIDLGRQLYAAPFVVLAHDAAPDPVFFYANLAAQQLFEMSWREMVRLPSRRSAEPLAQEERQRLLDRVASQGYIDDYAGVRIASSGRRFRIAGATVWNLLDHDNHITGQAAAFGDWVPLG